MSSANKSCLLKSDEQMLAELITFPHVFSVLPVY